MGNPRDHLTRNTKFIDIFVSIQGKIFLNIARYTQRILFKKVQRRTKNDFIENLGSDLILEITWKMYFSPHLSFQDHINKLGGNRLMHQFYWDLSHF